MLFLIIYKYDLHRFINVFLMRFIHAIYKLIVLKN